DVSVRTAEASIDLYVGDAHAALRRIDEAWGAIERIGVLRLQQPRIELAALRARALLGLGDRDRLREVRTLADDIIKEGAQWAIGLGHLLRGAAHAGAGAAELARQELVAAEEQLVATGMMGHL